MHIVHIFCSALGHPYLPKETLWFYILTASILSSFWLFYIWRMFVWVVIQEEKILMMLFAHPNWTFLAIGRWFHHFAVEFHHLFFDRDRFSMECTIFGFGGSKPFLVCLSYIHNGVPVTESIQITDLASISNKLLIDRPMMICFWNKSAHKR